MPEVTLAFWVIKIAATTLGETGGDVVSMSMNLGYLLGTMIFTVIFIAAVVPQIRAQRFHPFLYWTTIVATTTVGTPLADFATRSLGIGYAGGSLLLLGLLLGLIAGARYWTAVSRTLLFWLAFILTRPLGAVLGDLLDKPLEQGGFNLSRFSASAALLCFMTACIVLFSRKPAPRGH